MEKTGAHDIPHARETLNNARLKPESHSSSSSTTDVEAGIHLSVPNFLQWIPANWNWTKLKPVLRCAVVAWVSLVIFVIPSVEVWLGQASFLILIAAFLSPPSDPFMAVLEREILILAFLTLAWAWVCLGLFLANLARTVHNPSATFLEAISGMYLEPAPTVVIAVFVFFGSAFFLYIKARQGPGPYLFACVFSCICIDISMTTAVLFPYPFYTIGKAIVLPLAFHSAIALIASILVFPSSISAQFTTRLQGVLSPLVTAMGLHQKILKTSPGNPEFPSMVSSIVAAVNQSESALVPLAASARLLKSDLIFCRFRPEDFVNIQNMGRRIAGRANGMNMYFSLIDPTRERFPKTPGPSHVNTPGFGTPIASRHSPERSHLGDLPQMDESKHVRNGNTPHADSRPPSRSHSYQSHHHHHPHHKNHHHLLHNSLLHLAKIRQPHRYEHAVGVFESQRYMNLEETRLSDPDSGAHTLRAISLLGESCDCLLENCRGGLVGVRDWLGNVRQGRFQFWVKKIDKDNEWKSRLDKIKTLRSKMFSALEEFRNDRRHRVLDPYRDIFESVIEGHPVEQEIPPPHHYLFHCFVYQYHLTQFGGIVIEMLDEVIKLEKERRYNKIWTPAQKILTWNHWEIQENSQDYDDDNPDVIRGVNPAIFDDLGMPQRRDPDALPPRNKFEWILNKLYLAVAGLGGGNSLFAVKAGLFTVALCLPSFFKSTATFAYENRFSWAIFMGQLTLARFRGDTAFGLFARVVSTFLGGAVGMAMWYISCGNGMGNPFGLAAVCGVCFPFFFFARLYHPAQPMTVIVFFVTAILVIGYSYQDLHITLPGEPGLGFTVFWRRFVLVTCGVFAAFIVSFLPPSTTIRRYQRHWLATTSTELGAIYCSIITFANSRNEPEIQEIITSLLAIRNKLTRSVVLRTNVRYEFSLRGRWPANRYHTIMNLQMQIAYSLSHFLSVVEHLEPAWTSALLRRTRFTDPDFQGDMLAVITMVSSSLRSGSPLPQITPCPLLDRFMLRYHGLDVIHKDSEQDYGLPRLLTLDTLQNEQYMFFCVGVATAFGIVNRLDRLMLAVKEVVGEQYHIHGLGVNPGLGHGGVELGPRTSTVHFRPPNDV